MPGNESRAFLIDASIYIFRYYFSLPDHWQSRSGYNTAAVYGYGRWLLKFLEQVQPTMLGVCFDESLESCFRNELYPDYKCSRALPDAELAYQLTACRELTEQFGIATYASTRFEADDLLATLALRCRKKNIPVTVVTRDKDLAQIVQHPNDCLWDFPEGDTLGRHEIYNKYGVYPEQVASFLALVGDNGDDIPGVPGLGVKTAAALLRHFADWPELRNNLHSVAQLNIRGAGSLAQKLENYQDQIDIALRLSSVFQAAPLGRRFRLSRKKVQDVLLRSYCEELGLGRGFIRAVDKELFSS